jgi:hypothetical protein
MPGEFVAECLHPVDHAGNEQFCPNMILTYNSPDKHLGGVTYGGYSESVVVDERFVLRVPPNLLPSLNVWEVTRSSVCPSYFPCFFLTRERCTPQSPFIIHLFSI